MSDRIYNAGAVILASGVAISAWALFPSSVESGIHAPLPEASTPAVADVTSARDRVLDSRVNAYDLMNANLIKANLMQSKPPMYASVTAGYASPVVDVGQVPLRSKLQALLMLLHSQSGDLDPAALEAKLQALLQLPDPVLAQLMEDPDLVDLNKMLDAVFVGTSDVSRVKTELDKIEVAAVPGTSEQIQVIKVNGRPQYTVHSPAVDKGTEMSAVSPVSAPPPPGEPVPMASRFGAVTDLATPDLAAPAFAMAPSSEQFTPPPPPPPASAPARLSAPALTLAPSSEQFTPPPAPAPTRVIPRVLAELTRIPRTSIHDIINSGNKFEPGARATQHNAHNSSPTNTPAPQTAPPSTPATGGGSPAEAGGVTGGVSSPSDSESGGTSSEGGTSP